MVPSSCESRQWLDQIRVRVRVDNGETMHSADDVDFMTYMKKRPCL